MQVMTINFYLIYFPMVVSLLDPQLTFCSYVDDSMHVDGSIYLYPYDHASLLEHNTHPFINL